LFLHESDSHLKRIAFHAFVDTWIKSVLLLSQISIVAVHTFPSNRSILDLHSSRRQFTWCNYFCQIWSIDDFDGNCSHCRSTIWIRCQSKYLRGIDPFFSLSLDRGDLVW
jgi:hypothetical protein